MLFTCHCKSTSRARIFVALQWSVNSLWNACKIHHHLQRRRAAEVACDPKINKVLRSVCLESALPVIHRAHLTLCASHYLLTRLCWPHMSCLQVLHIVPQYHRNRRDHVSKFCNLIMLIGYHRKLNTMIPAVYFFFSQGAYRYASSCKNMFHVKVRDILEKIL